MFSRSNKGSANRNAAGSAARPKPAPPSIIGPDLRVVGDLASDGEIQIDGTIDGDIRTKALLVGETATVRGEIVAESVRVHGMVNGQIKAQAVSLARTARVIGDILHEDLSIETGAFLEGHCKRISERQDTAAEGPINLVVTDDQPADAADDPDADPKTAVTGHAG